MTSGVKAFAASCLIAGCSVIAVAAAADSVKGNSRLGWRFAYDDEDRITKITDPAGRDTNIEYVSDRDNKQLRKLVRTTADGERVTQEFDTAGQLTRMSDAEGVVSYQYDPQGRLTQVQREGGPAIRYTHDTLDRVTSLEVGDFYRIEYIYDFLGRLASMKTPAGTVEYEYLTGQGQVVRKLPNGVATISVYEPNGELSQITHGLSRDPNARSYQVLAEYSYQYRPDGLIAAIRERSSLGDITKAYTYDTVGRLVNVSGPGQQRYLYEYDRVGNRLKATSSGNPLQTGEYDWADRLTSLDGTATTHDAAGNLTSVTLGGTPMSYRYNANGQLAEVGGGRVNYRYDGDGRLISRTAGGVETTFIPDPVSRYWQPLVMEAKGGSRTLVVWEGALPLLQIKDGKPEYLLHDHLGSVRMVANAQGEVAQRFDYEPFGSFVNSEATTDFAPRFAGMFCDREAEAYLTPTRAYNPKIGRWAQAEPAKTVPTGRQEDLSRYGYGGDNPVNLVDLTGRAAEPPPYSLLYAEALVTEIPESFKEHWTSASTFWSQAFRGGIQFGPQTGSFSDQAYRMGGRNYGMAVQALSATAVVASAPYVISTGSSIISESSVAIRAAGRQIGLETRRFLTHSLNRTMNWLPRASRGPSVYNARDGIELISQIASRQDLASSGWLVPPGTLNPAQLAIVRTAAVPVISSSVVWPMLAAMRSVPITLAQVANPGDPGEATSRVLDEIQTRPLEFPVAKGALALRPISAGETTRSSPVSAVTTWHGAVFGASSEVATPEEIAAYKAAGKYVAAEIPTPRADLTPSSVGGVYLGGAGKSVEGVGVLDGVTIDANNNLVLIGEAGTSIKLPPLRLDDVVTVFRSVYLQGEGPTVTIDPNPKNPDGSAMIIRHSPATDGTYVGWVLYQADRLMKGYNLGKDNLTTKDVQSSVPGYAKVLDTIYFGGAQTGNAERGGSWERFWIVPAEARRFARAPDALTLFDVPLKVRTQPMEWKHGKLVDDPKRPPSKGAAAFTEWFTGNYDQIAQEQFLTPPPEAGIKGPVPVFTELRRIALLTAIAEKLRDQGVPLPFWMRDYEVRRVPFEETTPALRITRSNGNVTARIFGGVNLSPPTEDVKVFTEATGVGKLPKPERAAARETLDRAVSLAQAVHKEMPVSEPLEVKTLTAQGANYQAVAVPGSDTQALAPARLDEADLVVPLEGGDDIRLVRSFNSFFNPSGPWGRGWALDLPRLEGVKVPQKRDSGSVTYRIAHEVVTPLNSLYARFSRIAIVPELNGSKLLVPDQPSELLALADSRPDFLTGLTKKVIRKDGVAWHFSEAGGLVATDHQGFRTVYERDAKGRVSRIVGLRGKVLVATIELSYDKASGRLQAATGRRETGQTRRGRAKTTVRYAYDNAGRLTTVDSDQGRTGYQYDGSRVVAVTYRSPPSQENPAPQEVTVRRYEYDPRGQLLAETDAAGARTEYRVAADASGHTLTVAQAEPSAGSDSVRYDPAFRPIEARYADGTTASWSYPEGGGMSIALKDPDGGAIRFTEKADLSQRTLALDANRKLVGHYDTLGRLTSLTDNDRLLLRQEWYPGGPLRLAANETTAVRPEYDQDGLVTRVVLMPPEEQEGPKRWQETKLDPAGRPREITDYRGLHILMDYDNEGELTGLINQRDGKNYGFQLARDAAGRIQEVKSSWGNQQYAYDPAGQLERMEMQKGGAKALMEWKSGQLERVRRFDGGEIKIDYDEDAARQGLPARITTPSDLVLGYAYDDANRLTGVDIGGQSHLALGYDGQGRLSQWSYSPPRP